MDLIVIIGKLINKQDLTPAERQFLLDFFASLQAQKITRLSQIAFNAGDLTAGRFIAPSPISKSTEPTDAAFTGSFMSGIGELFSGTTYNTGGVSLGVLQWGASQTNGKLYFGGGTGFLDAVGLNLKNYYGALYIEDSNGDQYAMSIGASPSDQMQFTNDAGGMQFFIALTNATQPYIHWRENPSLANQTLLEIPAGAAGIVVVIGNELVIDGGAEHRLEIGQDHYIPTRNSSNKTTIFNEANQDMDFNIQGDNDNNLFYVDADVDRVGIGTATPNYKLDVNGDINSQGGVIRVDGVDIFTTVAISIVDYATPVDGWIPASEGWTRTGNHTFTLVGDQTATHQKGTKVRYKDGGAFEYGVIGSSSHAAGTTTINLIVNTDFTMAAATITNKYISYIENPEGFPDSFNWTPTHTRNGTNYTNVPTVQVAKWSVEGRKLHFYEKHTQNATPGGTSYQRFTLPIVNPFAHPQIVIGANFSSGVSMNCIVETSAATCLIEKYDGTVEATASQVYLVEGFYFI